MDLDLHGKTCFGVDFRRRLAVNPGPGVSSEEGSEEGRVISATEKGTGRERDVRKKGCQFRGMEISEICRDSMSWYSRSLNQPHRILLHVLASNKHLPAIRVASPSDLVSLADAA